MNVWVKQMRMTGEYLRLAVRRQAEYKAGFYTYLVHQVVTVVVWLVFWKVILGRVGDFGSWDFPRMVLLTGFVTVNTGLWLTFGFVWRLPQEILKGEFSVHLIKPVHPFVHFLMRRLNLRALPRVAIGAGLLVVALVRYDVEYTAGELVLAGVMSALSFLTTFLPFAIVCLTAFWIGRAEFLRDLFVELFLFENYPLSEFPTAFIAVFTFVVPVIFSATVPVLVLTQLELRESLGLLALLLGIIGGQLWLFAVLWRKGLRRYESFGG